MKTQVQQFHNKEFGSVEIVLIDGKPYFPAAECAKILGYTNPQKAIRDHCKGVNETFTPTAGGVQRKKYIPEGDLYRLIIRSKLPAAERFECWVFDEVLPCIRKHGFFATDETLDEMLRSPKFTEALIRNLAVEREKNAALEELAVELAPRALYCDLILQSKSVVPVSLIAKDYGMSATAFNRLLHRIGVQFRSGGTWLLYQKYARFGYTQTRTYSVDYRVSAMHTCWTQKGRLFLYETLKNRGILPLIEKRAI
ncbi:MAG: phage antirepressor KilAC domain-containing protein [Oscillospiraceae bacterium]|nr:phage antirepressor KilAC domain-containing protein [Oscillospiraceae bacterium]